VARIPDDLVERLKAEVSLVSLAEAAGVTLRKTGADLTGCCPFHEDGTPSLVISPAKNLWHCLGACQAGGSVIDWVMRAEGVSFRHAVELLRDGMPAISPAGRAPGRSTVRRLASPVDRTAADDELLGQVADYYHRVLQESPDALGYLAGRKIGHPEAIETFRLGYADRSLGLRLPDKRRKEGAEIRGRLEKLGIFRASGHEHFAGSLIVPVVDEHGLVTEVYGRKVRDDLRAGTPKHLYLPGPHRGVWNLAALAASDEIILCESLIDALTFWSAGFRHVTASFGAGGFTAGHAEAFARHQVRRVLIAYDRDDAGDRAAAELSASLMTGGIECFRIEFPAGQDASDVAVAARSATDALGRLIRSASWMGSGPGPARRNAPLPAPPPAVPEPEPGLLSAAGSPPAVPEPELAHTVASAAQEPPAPVPPAAVSPAPAAADEPVPEVTGREVVLTFGERRWRVRGLERASSFDVLRVNVMCSAPDADGGSRFHVDTFDLYSARARAVFVAAAAAELGLDGDVVKRDLGRVLLACEGLADEAVTAAQAPADEPEPMSDADRAAALGLLRDPDLAGRITADFGRAGMAGESVNCLVGYLAAVSRKLPRPLAVIVQSTSAAGKSALMDAVLAFVPAEDRVRFSAMTGQSLFYMGESDLAHKVLAVAEEEGAERAAYALKLLSSDGELSIASTGKDTVSGRLVTHTYTVTGPAAIFLTTTAIDVDEELLNRCLVLTVDEGRAQTKAIHQRQRAAQTLDGLLARAEADQVRGLHQNAQRLLEPLAVVNPHAGSLAFADATVRARRDHVKYLTLIAAVTLLHQHQRQVKTVTRGGQPIRYVETTRADIELADRLASQVLARSLDELPPGTRRLLDAIAGYVTARCQAEGLDADLVRFTRRQLREALPFGDTQLKVHLARLADYELVIPHRTESGGFCYELAWQPAPAGAGDRGLPGVTGPAVLAAGAATMPDRSGSPGLRSGPGRPPVGGWPGGGRPSRNGANRQASGHLVPAEDGDHAGSADPGEANHQVIAAAGGGAR
jgi:DNA primase